ncbi:MAG: hypothetical protein ACM3NR_04275 [Methanosarcina sp.]
MKTSIRFKVILPHIIAVLLFTVLSFAYFYPVIEGKILRANDAIVSTINAKEIIDYREKYDKEPLWTNSIFSGMPAYLISTRYPGNLFKYVDTVLRQYKMPVSVLFISMLGFYLLLLMFGLNPWLGMIGALAYGFSSFFFQILAAGHNTQAIALAYMPPMIGSIWYAYRKDAIKGALMTAFFLTLQITANHVQITYYAMLCLLVFGIFELVGAIRNKTVSAFLKTSAILVIPFIIALGINFASLYTTWEYGKYSIRGKSDLTGQTSNITDGLDKDYILQWSYGVGETFNMLIPNFKGGSSEPFDRNSETFKALRQNNKTDAMESIQKYWGTQPGTAGPHYVGAIIIFLFVLGLLLIKGPEKWWLLVATILSIMLAWGKNFMPLSNLFIELFPGYNKFRAVTMILVIAEFCIPLLGFIALRDIFNGTISRNEIIRKLKIAAGITGGFVLLVLVIPGIAGSFLGPYESSLPDWIRNPVVTDRKALLRTDAFRSLIFILLAAGVLAAYLYDKLKMNLAILALGLLIFLDLFTIDKRYLNADNFERPKSIAPSNADKVILKDKSVYRVLNLATSTFNDNSPTSYFHKSVGGYHGAKLERYKEFIDSALTRNIDLIYAAYQNAKSAEDFQAVFGSTYALNMLNCKYLIGNPDGLPLTNTHILGNAWFVEKPVFVENANQEISMLKKFNPADEALIDRKFSDQVKASDYSLAANDTIELTSYLPNELKYKYSAQSEKLAVFSEIYYPAGWKCFIDGKESSYFRTDYILRGMILPAGQHEVRFSFEPSSYITGNRVSLASSILLFLLIAGYFTSSYMKKAKENNPT